MWRFLACFAACFLALAPFREAEGHGMVMAPLNRASRWRTNSSAPANYEDNALFCGGREAQWGLNGGQCGLCGDDFGDPTPRRNELGGPFGEGIVVAHYAEGSVLSAEVLITANHEGYFKFALCNVDEFQSESETCFEAVPLRLPNGDEKYTITNEVKTFKVDLQLPEGVTCKHCVFQWTWTTANSWGLCENGQQEIGCGPQETFRTCSDISIY